MRVAVMISLSLLACGGKKDAPEVVSPPAVAADAASAKPVTADAGTSKAGPTATPDASAADAVTGAADASADAGPASDAGRPADKARLAPTAFTELRKTPQTLHYLVNGHAVACQVSDAGVADSDVDIKVACTPRDLPWSCVREGYFQLPDARAAPAFWRSEGCYAARADGLWYFESCPSDKAAFDDPGAAKGTRMLSANMLVNAKAETEDEELVGGQLALGDAKFADICRTRSESGMMKTASFTHCMAPSYGYVSASAEASEMQVTSCHDWSRLEAVAPGLEAPVECLGEQRFVGTWSWVTSVEVAKDAKMVGAKGQYRAEIRLGADCRLEATIEKIGVDGRAFGPEKVQRGTAVGVMGCGSAGIGELCVQFPVHLEDQGKAGFDARFVLAESSAEVSGVFRYEGKDVGTKVAGLLQGRRGEGSVRVLGRINEEARCLVKTCRGNARKDGPLSWSCPDLEAFVECVGSSEP